MERILVLVRHGQSEWNAKNLFTGWRNPPLTQKGIQEAKQAGRHIKAFGLTFDCAYTSELVRAQDTLSIILDEIGQSDLVTEKHSDLNERNYGDLNGLNKNEARKKWGEEQVHIWRRSYDTPPPGGESLKDTAARVLPYYLSRILPDVLAGKKVLVSAHGNSLRALIMVLDGLSKQEVTQLNLETGVPVFYRLGADSRVLEKKQTNE